MICPTRAAQPIRRTRSLAQSALTRVRTNSPNTPDLHLASPHSVVWGYFHSAVLLARSAVESESESDTKAYAASTVFLSVAAIEAYLSVLAKLWIDQTTGPLDPNHKKVSRDLERRRSLGYKIRNWPQMLFGRKIDPTLPAAKRFLECIELRNGLTHFESATYSQTMANLTLNGLVSNATFSSLNGDVCVESLLAAKNFLRYLVELQLPSEKSDNPLRIESIVHGWTGLPRGSLDFLTKR